mgnify:CR=1 FL=1
MKDLYLQGIEINWSKIDEDSYLRTIPALNGLKTLSFDSPLTCFVGENGSGKSTLLEGIAIACGFNPEGGTKNYQFSTCNDYSELHDALRLLRGWRKPAWGYFLRAESFFNVATKEEEYARGFVPSAELHQKSHGESFLQIAQDQFKPHGLYLLDEPEAALSPQHQLTLLLEIMNCIRTGSQFIIVSHSPILLGIPEADIRTFDQGPIHSCRYEETESYRITKLFINDREMLLKKLLSEENP